MGEKEVRIGADPGSIFHVKMTWTVEGADREGEWTFGVQREWGEEVWQSEILPKLTAWSDLTWAEIDKFDYGNAGKRHKMHHSMSVDDICDEAQLRLIELEKVEETIFRFRLGNMPRLWGFRRAAKFHIYWYDPTHQIYPVD